MLQLPFVSTSSCASRSAKRIEDASSACVNFALDSHVTSSLQRALSGLAVRIDQRAACPDPRCDSHGISFAAFSGKLPTTSVVLTVRVPAATPARSNFRFDFHRAVPRFKVFRISH